MAFKTKEQIEARMFKPTQEQKDNLALLKTGNNVKIIAGPGSGKSSSLRYNAANMPHKQFLVLCFNAANAEESNNHPDKPDNITYCTGHSLAHKAVMDTALRKKLGPYLNYVQLPINDSEIKELLDTNSKNSKDLDKHIMYVYRAMLDCIVKFCRSDELDIQNFTEDYINYIFNYLAEKQDSLSLTEYGRDLVIDRIVIYWNNLINSNTNVTITHDVYLKMYQLSQRIIKEVWDKKAKCYVIPDIIALDEAQDTNPVMQAIFEIQPHQRLIIGDPMQQLYTWRGAGDAMNCFNDFTVGYLTESFRFNNTIASIANKILANVDNKMRVKGSSTKTEINTYAHLCRTNASVVERIFAELETGRRVYTSIKVSDVFSKLFHMQSCFFGETPRYPNSELSSIIDKKSLIKALEFSEELKRLDNLRQCIIEQGYTLLSAKNALDTIIVKKPEQANIVVSTIHASKGLEYDHVTIDNDFLTIKEDTEIADAIDMLWNTEALYCMLFVGVTRARVSCALPCYLEEELL